MPKQPKPLPDDSPLVMANNALDVMNARSMSVEGVAHLAGLPRRVVEKFLDAEPVSPGDQAVILMVVTSPMPAEERRHKLGSRRAEMLAETRLTD